MLALKAENISKQYRLGQVGTGTLSHDLNRFWYKIRGKEDPYLKIGEANDRASKGNSEYVWSLRDINFEINQGDAIGIIGKNGAGKSTLLKLLSKVTKPTTGKIYTEGRIASLLEVGTGFHPDMTGRENVYLNGAILGMTRKEITRKFDEIVDFSGVERYIDTPVKRYSSGMYVRLAFAVAAHLESEILIVDEVLAVGDAEFQKKCLGKMGDVSQGEGRTVLFVSHNMGAMLQLCNSSLFLRNGMLEYAGNIHRAIDLYNKSDISSDGVYHAEPNNEKDIYFTEVSLHHEHSSDVVSTFKTSEYIVIKFTVAMNNYVENAAIFMTILNSTKNKVFSAETVLKKDQNTYYIKIEKGFLAGGIYSLNFLVHLRKVRIIDHVEDACSFGILDDSSLFMDYGDFNHGVVLGKYEWYEK